LIKELKERGGGRIRIRRKKTDVFFLKRGAEKRAGKRRKI